jgi:hypothetical protein
MPRMTFLPMALTAGLLTLTPGCGGAPPEQESFPALTAQSLMYGSHDYLFIRSARTWDQARLICESFGYGLVTLNDAQEQTWLRGFEGGSAWWMGYNDIAVEGNWQWSHGTSTYLNWNSGEPNDSGGEDCAVDNYVNSSRWNDLPCGSANYFICESLG